MKYKDLTKEQLITIIKKYERLSLTPLNTVSSTLSKETLLEREDILE